MNFRDDRLPPLWVERSDLTWESDLSEHELYLESLDERPSRVVPRADSSLAAHQGVDTTLSPRVDGRPGSYLELPGPNLEKEGK